MPGGDGFFTYFLNCRTACGGVQLLPGSAVEVIAPKETAATAFYE